MGKKLLSLCMALALCLGLLPVTALAVDAPNNLYVGNQNVKSGEDTTYWITNDSGELTQSNEDGTWNVKYDPSTATLTLKNATIKTTATYSQGAVIYAHSVVGSAVSLTINLEGTNKIECDTASYGIYVNAEMAETSYGKDASLTITGNGSLDVSGSSYGIYVKSGSGDASLTINNVSVEANITRTGPYRAGVYVQSSTKASVSPKLSLAVNGGSLTTSGSASGEGIKFYVGAYEATRATTSLTVTGNAIVDARTGGISASGVSGNPNVTIGSTGSTGGIVFDGNTGTVYGDVTLQDNLEIGEGESLDIPSGASLTIPNNITLTNEGTVTTTGNGTLTNNGKIDNSGTLPDNIQGSAPPKITTTSLPYGEVDKNYSQPLAATGNDTITWSSSDLPEWLTLDSNGTISGTPTAAGASTFTVTATNDSGSDSKEYTLTINSAPVLVTSVTLDQAELALYTGQSETLTATVTPNDATNPNVTWSSDRSDVATVENGKVTAKAAGTATITVTTEDGGFTDTCQVTVRESEPEPTPPPYIPPSKPNWTSVARKLANAQPGDTVTVKMNGETEVPGEVWETIAGRDVTVILDMGGNVSWTVDGNDVPTATHFADMDFGVDRNTTGIDVDVINAITGEVSSVQITLAHDGEFGFTLTLTAPLGRENAGYWANLYHYDENAKTLNYETSAEIQKDGTASLKMTHASQYAIIIDDQAHQLPFTDVTSGAWYEGAVRYAYLHDIMEGMSATTFQPNGTLSRAMAVQIFYNLEGQPDISDENLGYPYEDVNAQAWYGDAVYWARITGVATGYGDGTFQPTDSITRQEFAQMLYNYAEYKGYDLTAAGDLSQFPDSGSVADWAEAAMSWANGNELINGHDDGTIDAAGIGTRAQAASILMRFDQNLVEK